MLFALTGQRDSDGQLTLNWLLNGGSRMSPSIHGTHSVYVIELRPEVRFESKFRRANPQMLDSMECFYVGMTIHKPVCRFKQHMSSKSELKTFTCDCPKARGKIAPYDVANRFVRKYGLRLRPDLYNHLNKIHGESKALEVEKTLAEDLRRRGHGVWQN